MSSGLLGIQRLRARALELELEDLESLTSVTLSRDCSQPNPLFLLFPSLILQQCDLGKVLSPVCVSGATIMKWG